MPKQGKNSEFLQVRPEQVPYFSQDLWRVTPNLAFLDVILAAGKRRVKLHKMPLSGGRGSSLPVG
jgi:hypothetical protein